MFTEVYSKIEKGSPSWANLAAPNTTLYPWDANSTYIKNPPYFDDLQKVNHIIFVFINLLFLHLVLIEIIPIAIRNYQN